MEVKPKVVLKHFMVFFTGDGDYTEGIRNRKNQKKLVEHYSLEGAFGYYFYDKEIIYYNGSIFTNDRKINETGTVSISRRWYFENNKTNDFGLYLDNFGNVIQTKIRMNEGNFTLKFKNQR